MTATTVDSSHVVTGVDDNGTQRISVYGNDTAEICGAFKPVGRADWQVYVTTAVTQAVGHSHTSLVPPHLHLPRRQDAHQWVELIAHLYEMATAQSIPPM